MDTEDVVSIEGFFAAEERLRTNLIALAKKFGAHRDGVRVWYRGHARGDYTLVPSLFRLTKGRDAELDLYDHYRAFKNGLSGWALLIDMQHYFVPTRLLDWTTELWIALYFALKSEEYTDPTLYILHPCLMNYLAGRTADPRPFLIDSLRTFDYPGNYGSKCPHTTPLAIMPLAHNDRIKAQSGMFTVHGDDALEIERSCPDAVARIVLRSREVVETLRQQTPKAKQVFPDETGMAMTLVEEFGLKPIPDKLIKGTLLTLWKHDNRDLREGNTSAIRTPGISGSIMGDQYIARAQTAYLRSCVVADDPGIYIVIGGAGSGKTNFLVDLILGDALYRRVPVLFYSLNAFRPTERSLLRALRDFLQKNSVNPYEAVDERALESMIAGGRVTLVLDGIDELARNQGEERVATVLDEVSRWAGAPKRRAKIIMACRDHIYQRLRDRGILKHLGDPQTISLDALPTSAIRAHLPNLAIQDNVLKIISETPLFYPPLLRRDSATGGSTRIASERELWSVWLEEAEQSWRKSGGGTNLMERLGEVATLMLQHRDDYVTEKELGAGTPLAKTVEELASQNCPLFAKESDCKFRFIHQAIREYVLADNIHQGLTNPSGTNVLFDAALDYESAETYIYLQELLPGRRMRTEHYRDWRESDEARWNNFARNYFEAVGMLGVDASERERAVVQALAVVQAHGAVRYKTRYNAARCLARLHPTSSDPYCEWATKPKWPEIDEGNVRVVYGYAARGFHQKEVVLGHKPPEVFIEPPERYYGALSAAICNDLLTTIAQLSEISELHRDGEFLAVNCAHALIRWFNPNFSELVRRAEELMRSARVVREARVNLFLALCVHGRPPREHDRVRIKTEFETHYRGDIAGLCERGLASRPASP